MNSSLLTRREILRTMAFALPTFFAVPGLYAEYLSSTPSLTEGPFYPNQMPLDTDNDLILIRDSITPAVGQVVELSGKVLSISGSPVRNLTVEIWQADSTGSYINTRSPGWNERDQHFQGYGRFLTGSTGEYRFRTIKPRYYEGRAPHIHLRVKQGDQELLTTQIFVARDPLNAKDNILGGLRGPIERELVTADFFPIPGSPTNELAAHFTIILGRTPNEAPHA